MAFESGTHVQLKVVHFGSLKCTKNGSWNVPFIEA